MQYVKRRTCSIEIEENAKLSTTTILGLKEITLMYVLNVIFLSMSDEAHTCICKTVYELNHLKIHKMSDVNKRHRKKLFRELQQLWLQVHDLVHKIKGKNWITRFQDYFMVTFICKTDWLAKWISSSLICSIECEIILIVNNCTGRCPIIPREVELDIWKSKMGGKDCTANNLICIPTSQPPLQETKPLLLKTWKLNEDKLPQNCLS